MSQVCVHLFEVGSDDVHSRCLITLRPCSLHFSEYVFGVSEFVEGEMWDAFV